jgi:ribosomal protein S18 acetylase RimI-like enzyme
MTCSVTRVRRDGNLVAVTHAISLAEGYTLRRATLFDVRAIHRLHRVIFPRDAYPLLDLALMILWPGVTNLKIAAPDGSLAGIVSLTGGLSRRHGWIIMIGVDPAHQRRGLGTALLHAVERRLRREYVRLTVRQGNARAIRLYEREGYTLVEKKFGYYRDGETGLVMEKKIDE